MINPNTKDKFIISILSIINILVLLGTIYFVTSIPDAVALVKIKTHHEEGKIIIRAANPYRLSVRLEIKCDWNAKERRYTYWNLLKVPPKGQILIKVPNNLYECEIWPKIMFFN